MLGSGLFMILLVVFIFVLPAFLPLIIKKPEGRNIYGAMPKPMGFVEAIQSCLFNKFFYVIGRASRSEFWYFWLFAFIANLILEGLVYVTKVELLGLLAYVLYIPSIAVGVRRLHDINRSGWWLLLQFGLGFITLIILWVLPSDKDTRHLEDVF